MFFDFKVERKRIGDAGARVIKDIASVHLKRIQLSKKKV